MELVNVGLLLNAMLLTSPILQPHQTILLLLSAAVLWHVALDTSKPHWPRCSNAALPLLSLLDPKLAPSGLGKAIGVNAMALIFSLALILVSRRATSKQSSAS